MTKKKTSQGEQDAAAGAGSATGKPRSHHKKKGAAADATADATASKAQAKAETVDKLTGRSDAAAPAGAEVDAGPPDDPAGQDAPAGSPADAAGPDGPAEAPHAPPPAAQMFANPKPPRPGLVMHDEKCQCPICSENVASPWPIIHATHCQCVECLGLPDDGLATGSDIRAADAEAPVPESEAPPADACAQEAAPSAAPEIQTKHVKRMLSDVEKLRLGDDLAQVINRLSRLEQEKASIASEYAGRIKSAKLELQEKTRSLQNGYTWQDVDCQRVPDFDAGVIKWVSVDSGQVMRVDPMTDADRQLKLL